MEQISFHELCLHNSVSNKIQKIGSQQRDYTAKKDKLQKMDSPAGNLHNEQRPR